MEVLIVDSSVQIIERLAEIISEIKNIKTIHRAVSYTQASALLNKTKLAVVLLDADLPANKSVDLLREIKAAIPETAVIVLSIQSDLFTRQIYISAGADFFFDKYHEFEKIAATVNTITVNRK